MRSPDVSVDSTYGSGASVSSSLFLYTEGKLDYVKVTSSGYGYTGASVSFSSGTASASAVIENGAITSITLDDGGYGYTSAPIVSIVPFGTGGTGAAAVANVDMYSQWNYENSLTFDKNITVYNFHKNVPYEAQILVSPDENFRGKMLYSDSIYFEYSNT